MTVIATCHLKSNSPYSQSRIYAHDDPEENPEVVKKPKERPDDYDERTWRNKGHYDERGMLVIPGVQFKKSLEEAASYLGERIPGKGSATFAKHFLSGVLVLHDLPLGIKKADVKMWSGMMNSDGKRGGGKRVLRRYPIVPSWQGKVEFTILDSTITEDVFRRTLQAAGNYRGIGRWRAAVGGQYGRFVVTKIEWHELEIEEAA